MAFASILLVRGIIAGRLALSRADCVQSLARIRDAKQQWAFVNHKATNALPDWNDLIPFLTGNRIPVCPQGGTYTIGRVDELPKCSIGGPGHDLH